MFLVRSGDTNLFAEIHHIAKDTKQRILDAASGMLSQFGSDIQELTASLELAKSEMRNDDHSCQFSLPQSPERTYNVTSRFRL